MNHFTHTLKQIFHIYKTDIWMHVLFPAIGGIIGIIMVYVIMAADGSGEDYGKLGTLFAVLLGAIIIFFGEVITFQGEFNLAISMGKTRKDYIPARYVFSLVKYAVTLVVVLFVYRLEDFIYTAVYPNAVCELGFGMVFDNVGLCFFFILVLPVIVMICSGLFMKFGNKFFWVLYGIWMFGAVLLPQMHNAADKNPDSLPAKIAVAITSFFSGISTTQITIFFMVCLVVGIIALYFIFRKQRVTA